MTLPSPWAPRAAWSPRMRVVVLVPAPEVAAVDTVGAGDGFNGALAVALAEGRPLVDAAAWACAAGALAVTRPGPRMPCPAGTRSTGWRPRPRRRGCVRDERTSAGPLEPF